MEYSELLAYEPYSLDHRQKKELLTRRPVELTSYHMLHCRPYKNMMDSISMPAERLQEVVSRGTAVFARSSF